MIERLLYTPSFSGEWGRQMRFITGPRQSGKTTLAKQKLTRSHCENLYYLWDLRSVKNRYKQKQLFFTEDAPAEKTKKWVCFDEIHKIPKWKNILKGIFDSTFEHYQFIITGSAKFNIIKKAGDSLSGRYFTFHLFPLSLSELAGDHKKAYVVPQTAKEYISNILDTAEAREELALLLEFSGFPEPFERQSKAFFSKWSQDYMDTVIKEDISALTRIIQTDYLYDLYTLLPEMVSNPISEASLASHLEISHTTVKNYLKRLADFYLIFKIHPYSRNIKRAILKAPKCYIYNWSVIQDPGKRFENYVASELYSLIHLWMDYTGDKYTLSFVRTKDKKETDFLIVKNKTPWLLVEAKLSDTGIAGHHYKIQFALKNIPFVQICRQDNVCTIEKNNMFRISASKFFSYH